MNLTHSEANVLADYYSLILTSAFSDYRREVVKIYVNNMHFVLTASYFIKQYYYLMLPFP